MRPQPIGIALALLIATSGIHAAGHTHTPPAPSLISTSLHVSGEVENALNLSVDDLHAFPPQQIAEVPIICQSGANLGNLENFRGVALRDILDRAKIKAPGHFDARRMIIVATASDNYKAIFSWNELFNSSLGDGVIVFFEKDGKPLPDNEGRIAMISKNDLRTGPRHVNWLKSIEVRKISD